MRTKSAKNAFIFSLFFLFSHLCWGQGEILQTFNQKRVRTSTQAMYILGGWAIGNIAISGIQRSQSLGRKRYFHEMNVFWNLVNLGIAGAALYKNSLIDPSSLNLYESLQEQQRLEKILWFNVALNTSYIIAGGWLKERSKTSQKNPDRLFGYGNSLMLQGSFLLVYDLIHVWVQQSQSTKSIAKLLAHVQYTGNGWALQIIF